MQKLYSIQYLRAVAALAVVVFHAGGLRYGDRFEIGAAGVDIFFVISGFVMWSTTSAGGQSPRQFMVRRLLRIAPMYWMLTLGLIAAALIVPHAFPRLKLDAFHTVASLLFIPARSPVNGELWPVLVQGWTLNYEMFFYVIFALVLFLPKRARLMSLVAVFTAFALAGLLGTGTAPLFVVYTDPIMLEFLAGVVLARCYELGFLTSRRAGCLLLGAGLICYGWIAAGGLEHPRLLFWGVPAFLVVSGWLTVELNGDIVRSRLLALTGDASYSIYLTHGTTISILGKFAGALHPAVHLAVCIAVSTLAGIAVWWAIERPVTRWMQGAISRSKLARAGAPVALNQAS